MITATIAAGAALAAAFGGGVTAASSPPAAASAPMPAATVQDADEFDTNGSVTKERALTAWGFGFLGWYTPQLEECPPDAPYLTHHEYHPGSGWNIPKGVELKYGDPTIGVTLWPATKTVDVDGTEWIRQTGVAPPSSITNYRGIAGMIGDTNWVQITLHCTN